MIFLLTVISFLVFVGFFAASYSFPDHKKMINHACITWIALNVTAFMSPNAFIFFTITAIILINRCPKDCDERIFFFMVIFTAIPSSFVWFPYLIGIPILKINFLMLSLALLLLPLIIDKKKHTLPLPEKKLILTEQLAFALTLLIIILDMRDRSVTDAMRSAITNLWIMGTCLFAFSRILVTQKTLEYFLLAIAVSAFPLSLISLYQAAMGWEVYPILAKALSPPSTGNAFRAYSRGLFIRTPGTMTPIPFGMYMGIAFVTVLYFRHQMKSKMILAGFLVLSFFAVYASGARAAIILIALAIYFAMYHSPKFKKIKPFLTLGMVIVFFTYIITGELIDDMMAADEHGTFTYRVKLFETSMLVIQKNFFFGDRNYMSSPILEVMRQGQGIIDMVNIYLQIALPYGVITIAIMLTMIYLAFRHLNKARAFHLSQGNQINERAVRYLYSTFLGYFVVIATVSFVDRIEYYVWIFLGFTSSYIKSLNIDTKRIQTTT